MGTTDDFGGSKAALFIGDKLLITLRDDFAHIPCPNMWDLPGGGREGDETPMQTLHREVREEVGLRMDRATFLWERPYDAVHSAGWVMFYVAQFPATAAADIVFGDEGQAWRLVPPHNFLAMSDAIPSLQQRLRDWMNEAKDFI